MSSGGERHREDGRRPDAAITLPDDATLCVEGWQGPVRQGSPGPVLIVCATILHPVARLAQAMAMPVDLVCTPARLHDRPARIAAAMRSRGRIALACGHAPVAVLSPTSDGEGLLARTCREECLHLLALPDSLPAVGLGPPDRDCFIATDLMVRQFERLVWTALGLDRHPDLIEGLFAPMRRFVHLAADDDPATAAAAVAAAARLRLPLEREPLDLAGLAASLAAITRLP